VKKRYRKGRASALGKKRNPGTGRKGGKQEKPWNRGVQSFGKKNEIAVNWGERVGLKKKTEERDIPEGI